MKKQSFNFEKITPYGRRGPFYHMSDKLPILHHKQFLQAKITSRNNGPNTAYAEIFHSVEWVTSSKNRWYYYLSKHFDGTNACQKAKSWCNYLLNNPPNYYRTNGKGVIDVKRIKEAFKYLEEENHEVSNM